jgi:hypothetical protein
VRLTADLLLIDVADDDNEPGRYVLVDERRGDRINFEVGELATLLVAPLYLAAAYPPLKEAVIAKLLDLDPERRGIVGRVVQDAAEDLRRAAP